MRLTLSLCRQHVARMTKKNWYSANKRVLRSSNSENILASLGKTNIVDALEVIKPQRAPRVEKVQSLEQESLSLDSPPVKDQEISYLMYQDNNLVVKGTTQAQILTKTFVVKDELPEKILQSISETPEKLETLAKNVVSSATIFDAYQEKLPKRKNPEKPMLNFPRDYGITVTRKLNNLSEKFLQLCEVASGAEVARNRNVIRNGVISLPFEKDDHRFLFQLTSNLMINSTDPLSRMDGKVTSKEIAIPSLHPLHYTISFEPKNYYKERTILSPLTTGSPWPNCHTIFIHHNPEEVKHLTELTVTPDQILSRVMLKSFTVAANCAKQRFGENIGDLPEPVTVQCIQSDGKLFHFSVYQLNTLNLHGSEGKCNYWWSEPRIQLYEKSCYEGGRPTLEGYNPEVFSKFLAFYRNS